MKYVSTRSNSICFDFKQVLFQGFAPDGGLFVPNDLPEVPWKSWKGKSYPFIVGELLKIFLDDPEVPIQDLLKNVYNDNNFDDISIAPLIKFSNDVHVLELFHGPTWSFKDYALLLIGELLQYYLERENKRICLLIATSGDTGSSAIEAVKNKTNIDIIVLFPYQRITKTQELQMTTVRAENVHVVSVDCDSDELDYVIREVVADRDFNDKHNLGSINSINWARICIQMAHWFHAYLQTIEDPESNTPLNFAVPVGACGNLTSGLYAQKLGLPVRLIACSNKNDVVHNWIQSGILESTTARQSLAVAMDIQVPYNVERIIYILSNNDAKLTKNLMEKFYSTHKCRTPEQLKESLQKHFKSCTVDDEQILATVKHMHDKYSYQCCPHTATSLFGTKMFSTEKSCICISTAAPYKFPDIFKSLKLTVRDSIRSKNLQTAEPLKVQIWQKGEDWVKLLKEIICKNFNK